MGGSTTPTRVYARREPEKDVLTQEDCDGRHSDTSGTSPGKDVLRELLQAYAPCVVLMDAAWQSRS